MRYPRKNVRFDEPAIGVAQRATYDVSAAVELAEQRLRAFINWWARCLAERHARRERQLVRAAKRLLAQFDPSRLGENDDPHLRSALVCELSALVLQPEFK